MVHVVKILPKYFKAVESGNKKFELRRDDRCYIVGDELYMEEWTPEEGYTGKGIVKKITYVLRGCPEYGLMRGYCIIGWR